MDDILTASKLRKLKDKAIQDLFTANHGKKPSPDEIAAVLAQLRSQLAGQVIDQISKHGDITSRQLCQELLKL